MTDELWITHEAYGEMLEARAKLVFVGIDGALNEGSFAAWCMRRYHLKPLHSYAIKIYAERRP